MLPSIPFAGQWIGLSRTEPKASIVLELDNIGDKAIGFAYLYPEELSQPASYVAINASKNCEEFSQSLEVFHFDANLGVQLNAELLKEHFKQFKYPEYAMVKFVYSGENKLKVEWTSEIGTHGKAILTRAEPKPRSTLVAETGVADWKSFRNFVTDDVGSGMIFRGQANAWPLQTGFHRTNRKDLKRYLHQDIPVLHQKMSARTKKLFDLEKPLENGAFFNLVQHHGFPTPLLDWTYSPFVAAYFAFSGLEKDNAADTNIRIYAFDQNSYFRDNRQYQALTHIRPHFSIMEAFAIENDRAIPQQGLLTLTNLSHIEDFIEYKERMSGKRYLYAFDIPKREAGKALSDLRLMGITEATLFPGFDSICRELRRQYFG